MEAHVLAAESYAATDGVRHYVLAVHTPITTHWYVVDGTLTLGDVATLLCVPIRRASTLPVRRRVHPTTNIARALPMHDGCLHAVVD